ncbi:hypothetical protein [Paraburkholderia bannensis]|uniref:hypothetical protein n=1 Tax=Paraburkholderia bannensis TaxID=765414 RepID=UPI002AB6380E|nr:hypothetical protein [Paraburkholderia bannensis]
MKNVAYAGGSMHLYAQRTHWGAIEIRMVCALLPHKKPAAAKPIEFADVEEGDYVEPALVLAHDTAQQMIDELWRAGLRPTEGAGSAGQLASTERHLEDMRQIAFLKLGMHSEKK